MHSHYSKIYYLLISKIIITLNLNNNNNIHMKNIHYIYHKMAKNTKKLTKNNQLKIIFKKLLNPNMYINNKLNTLKLLSN